MSSQMTTDAARRKREAARDFLRSAVMPLIEEVLVKKFCQTMDVVMETQRSGWQPAPDVADYEQVLDDHRRLTRELDVLLNGEEGAAQQASLADLVAQLRTVVRNTGKPALAAPDVTALVEALETIQKVATHKSIHTDTQAEIALGGIAVICATTLTAYRKQGGEA